jgi:aminobenzoyl-glutamate utilization protein B
MAKNTVLDWIDQHSQQLTQLSDKIWELAEVGLQEHQSAAALIAMAKEHGFTVEEGVAGMPSAFVASFGSGHPVIAILGEYDALPGLSQQAHYQKQPLQAGAAGHGCGHNLLGVAALGGAIAVKEAIVKENLQGTVRFYGCPAEETLVGKVFMVRDGLFDDVDISMTWHPASETALWSSSSLAMNSAKFTFHGRSSHAAGDPENGRSALDAVELMNVGANYLREHVSTDARIHYVITNGGGEPNVVPPIAQVWYYVRAPRRSQVEEIFARLNKIAEGAALMTETTFDVELLSGCYDTIHNDVVGDVLLESMQTVGAPQFDQEDQEFAKKLAESYPPGHYDQAISRMKERHGVDLRGKYLMDFVSDKLEKGKVGAGSTDVGDVSWVTPTAQFSIATNALGTPGHSWQYAACSGMAIGHNGMLVAAKVLGLSALRFLQQPELIEPAKQGLKQDTKGQSYVSPIPEGQEPPLHQLGH